MELNSKIYVAGHNGLVGSAIVRNLKAKGYVNIIGKSSKELDLTVQADVYNFFEKEKPEYVILAAAKVGGINANNIYPADFIWQNTMIQCNVIMAAHKYKVKKLLFLGSTCIYPKMAPQPIKEEYLLSGYLEPTNEAYAIAKINGLEMCKFFKQQYNDNFISVMPTNLYGENDNFDLNNSHVMPALIRRIYEAKLNNKKVVECWGDGSPLREFLYVDDMADACVYLMENYDGLEHVNVGTGVEISIYNLVNLIKKVVDYDGEIVWNTDMPNGTPRKLTNVDKLHSLGWKHKVEIEDGVRKTYKWFVNNYDKIIK